MWGGISEEGPNTNCLKCRCGTIYPQRKQLYCLGGSLRSSKWNGLGRRLSDYPSGTAAKFKVQIIRSSIHSTFSSMLATSSIWGLSIFQQWVFAHPLLAGGQDEPSVSRNTFLIWPCGNHRREWNSCWNWMQYMTGLMISKSVLKWYKISEVRVQFPIATVIRWDFVSSLC